MRRRFAAGMHNLDAILAVGYRVRFGSLRVVN